MRAFVIDRLMLLMWVAPLAVLLLVSLGLVVLKRRSGLQPWMARLVAPPFYLVSLPIATLIVGADMLGVYSLLILLELLTPDGFSWYFRFDLFFLNPIPAFFFSDFFFWRPAAIGSFLSFWVSTFVSGYLLWQMVWREDHRRLSSRTASQPLRGLPLLICFAWAFCYLLSYIAWLMTPWGPSS